MLGYLIRTNGSVPSCLGDYVLSRPLLEPRREKSGLWEFRPGQTQIVLYTHKES